MDWIPIAGALMFIVIAPILGMLLAGIDRKISARMQGRKGPPLLQPYYDVRKLSEKEQVTVNKAQDFYVACSLLFMIITGMMFFAGGDLLLIIFSLTISTVFLILAAFSSNSPYAQIGAERELYVMMAYEPMVLITAIGFYMYTGSFNVSNIISGDTMPLIYLAGIFTGFLFILTLKFHKSPFDLSMSHHAHQELVKGMTTEFSGKTMARIEIMHWYENILLLGIVFLFFANGTWWGATISIMVCMLTYLFEVLIDNSFARMKWQAALKSSWLVALLFGILNLVFLQLYF
jgi:Formate hydrogenlyase subunit 4